MYEQHLYKISVDVNIAPALGKITILGNGGRVHCFKVHTQIIIGQVQ